MASSERKVTFAEEEEATAAAVAEEVDDIVDEDEGLAKQDLATLDVTKLTPLTPEVISRQATINIGTIGHVAHGKSTVVKAISGVKTIRFKSELVRNITIKLGYANAKIYKSDKAPFVYEAQGSSAPDEFDLGDGSGRTMKLVRHVSFVDCLTEEHQLLTERGFMFLSDIESLPQEEQEALQFAGYNPAVGHLLYEQPQKLIVKDAAVQKMVEITHANGAQRWSPASEACGSTAASLSADSVSVVVTPGHDMFVREGADAYGKRRADSLLPSGAAEPQPISLLAHAPEGVLPAESAASSAATVLKSSGVPAASVNSFLCAYGFWLHAGAAVSQDGGLRLSAGAADAEWVRTQLDRCEVGYSCGSADAASKEVAFTVDDARWSAAFARAAGVAPWVFGLQKEQAKAVLAGFSRAAGQAADGEYAVSTNSTVLRDDIVRLALHAGYAASFSSQDSANANSSAWRVQWSASPSAATPTIQRERDVQLVEHTGRTWCVSMPNGFVVARRAQQEAGVVTKASLPLIMGNCPGHDILMATMLNGAAVMDAAMLLVAGNEPCPQPQTSEHLAAVEIMQLKNIIILQNKIDLVKEEAAKLQHAQIKDFVAGTVADNAPIIPISAQLKYNIDRVAKAIVNHIPVPVRDFISPPRMIVIRSFDVNKPGEDARTLKGGVAGGSILQGVLRIGDEVEIRPGIINRDADGRVRCTPIFSKVVTLKAESNHLQYAVPGGLIGVGLQVDPTLTRADRLVGQVLGHKGQLPDIFVEIEASFYLLKRLLGVKTTEGEKAAKVSKLTKGETLMVNIGSTSAGGRVVVVKDEGKTARIQLTQPVCTKEDEKIALSRRVEGHFRLIGWGRIRRGQKLEIGADGTTVATAASADE